MKFASVALAALSSASIVSAGNICSGSSIDSNKWFYERWGSGYFNVNGEDQYYVVKNEDSYGIVTCNGGTVRITAKRLYNCPFGNNGGNNSGCWASARLKSTFKIWNGQGIKYRARLGNNNKHGFFPSVWLLADGSWPDHGEIDAMEFQQGWWGGTNALHRTAITKSCKDGKYPCNIGDHKGNGNVIWDHNPMNWLWYIVKINGNSIDFQICDDGNNVNCNNYSLTNGVYNNDWPFTSNGYAAILNVAMNPSGDSNNNDDGSMWMEVSDVWTF